jgi:glycine dehydrogenase
VISGKSDSKNNMLKNSPHTALSITNENWDHPYSREEAVFPEKWLKEFKYWPPVGRVENAAGDRNLVCTCPDISDYE